MLKLPPIQKIYEAYSAIADNRVLFEKENNAIVTSSNYQKKYIVTWKDKIYISNDNASYWQGYAGYPILAVLMLKGKLPFDKKMASYFGGINWNMLNKKYKRNYTKALDEILNKIKEKGIDCEAIKMEALFVLQELEKLDIVCKRGKVYPPK